MSVTGSPPHGTCLLLNVTVCAQSSNRLDEAGVNHRLKIVDGKPLAADGSGHA
jgi:hypothetical protein